MAPKTTKCARALALEIERRLTGGIAMGVETRHFLSSTFSIESPAELGNLLDEPDGSDAQSLLELLFTPDEAARAALEMLIERHRCAAGDKQRIVAALNRKSLTVPIKFSEQAGVLLIDLTEDLLETYVRGLKITLQLPPPLIEAIDRKMTPREGAQIKAALRHAPLELTDITCSFFVKLLERSNRSTESIHADLELCLAIFAEQPTVAQLFDLFMAKKRRLLQQLQLAADNMETLMLKGVRIPHIDQDEARRSIARIDDICLTVFEMTDPHLQIPEDVDLGNFSDPDDLDTAFRILS